ALEGLVYPDFGRCVVDSLPDHLQRGWKMEDRGSRKIDGETVSDRSGDARSSILDPRSSGQRFGGIDFGLRNPFAAVWGTLDRDGILWLTGEHFSRDKALSYHAKHLPRDVTW